MRDEAQHGGDMGRNVRLSHPEEATGYRVTGFGGQRKP